MKLRLLGVALVCLANVAHAASVGSITFDWSSLKITAGGVDVTSSMAWDHQGDLVDTGYIEGSTSGAPIQATHHIDPNTGWSISESHNDGGVATDAISSLSPGQVFTQTEVNYTGRADTFVTRYGVFTAPTKAAYTFSLDYILDAEITAQNSETSSGFHDLDVKLYAEIYVQTDVLGGAQPRIFGYEYDSTDLFDSFGQANKTGTITLDQTGATSVDGDRDPGAPAAAPLVFNAGETLVMFANAQASSRSYSSQSPPAVPVPPAAILFISGLGAFAAFGRKRSSAMVNGAS